MAKIKPNGTIIIKGDQAKALLDFCDGFSFISSDSDTHFPVRNVFQDPALQKRVVDPDADEVQITSYMKRDNIPPLCDLIIDTASR